MQWPTQVPLCVLHTGLCAYECFTLPTKAKRRKIASWRTTNAIIMTVVSIPSPAGFKKTTTPLIRLFSSWSSSSHSLLLYHPQVTLTSGPTKWSSTIKNWMWTRSRPRTRWSAEMRSRGGISSSSSGIWACSWAVCWWQWWPSFGCGGCINNSRALGV